MKFKSLGGVLLSNSVTDVEKGNEDTFSLAGGLPLKHVFLLFIYFENSSISVTYHHLV